MRRGASVCLVLLCCVFALWGATPGQRAPALQATTLHGQRMDLTTLRGRVVLVDFWASWCEPCRRWFPVLQSLSQRYASRGLVVIAVSVDQDPANCRRFVNELRPGFPIVHDRDQRIVAQWAPDTLPTTYLIDRAGIVRWVHHGSTEADSRSLERQVLAALGVGP